ncbi:glycosyltransferase family 2 protein [Actinomycetospora sp. CA-101289]|uniref:glycosyltransferase family 2 protein n=1 Tax=Actinomycetospora sp. CA-101289 TaxID=3239893 RepID=UPI003D96A24C
MKTEISVVIPVLNDAGGIERCLRSIQSQRDEHSAVSSILVCDGGSRDGTRDVVGRLAADDARIVLLHNEHKTVPHAMNLAVRHATTPVVVRVDSHAALADDYVDTAVRELEETGADVLGGPMVPVGRDRVGRAVAWALTHRVGAGGASFHRSGVSGPAESVYMGVFPAATFARFGPFDTAFTRNQDDEYTYRVNEQGGLVYLSAQLRSTYEPRGSVRAVWRQFYQYGLFKPLVLRKHPSGIKARHVAPSSALLLWGLALLGGRRRIAALPLLGYLTVVLASCRDRSPSVWGARLVVVLAMHLGYGLGFAVTLVGGSGRQRARL